MFKKKQLALILLTLVMMLTVYYLKSPKKEVDKPVDENPIEETSGRLEPLTAMRLALKNERTEAMLALDAIIASNESTTEQVNIAIEEKRSLNELNENELLLELKIINLGYRDAFVHATSNGVEITVVSDEHSIQKANEIILMTMTGFNRNFNNVSVEFETVSEVMGIIDEAA